MNTTDHITEPPQDTARSRLLRRSLLSRAAGLSGVALATGVRSGSALAASPKAKMDTPTISCAGATRHTISLRVCAPSGAGATGAPAGFSIQWQKLPAGTDCASFVWPSSDDPNLCKASFSGMPGCSIYNLAPGACVTVEIGNLNDAECGVGLSNCGADELDCGATYVFRAFAHANSTLQRSEFTANQCCATADCEDSEGCVFSQGYWKTHGPVGCNPSGGDNTWPVTSLTIGGRSYTDTELCANLQKPVQGNAVIMLSHHLIAALLNMASGASAPSCDASAASALLNGLDINSAVVATSTTQGQAMVSAATCLERYNTGGDGISPCA